MALKSLKHYRKGDIIMTSKPLVYVVVDEMKGRLCDYCLAVKPSLMSCSDCRQMSYCNQICQQNDWAYHRLECHTFANTPHMESSAKIMIRLWLMISADPTLPNKMDLLPNGQYLCLNEIEVNGTVSEDIVRLMELNESTDEDLSKDSLELSPNLSTEEMAVLQFKQVVNRFTECQLEADLSQLWKLFLRVWSHVLHIDVVDSDRDYNAYGLYVQLSALSHSCQPNACYVSYGTRLQVRAIKPIKPSEQITISYIDFANPQPIRRQLLKSYFIEDCDCLKCRIASDSNVEYERFHKLNAEFIQMIALAKEDTNGDNKDLISIAEELTSYYESIYEDFYPEFSLFLYKYLQIMCLNASQTKAVINRNFVEFVIETIRITHGIDHKLYRKVPIVSNITLLDLEKDIDSVIKTLKSKPMSGLKRYTLRAFILLVILLVIYQMIALF